MYVFKKYGLQDRLVLLLTLILASRVSEASTEVSAHFRGLSANAGGIPVIGARARFGVFDTGVQQFSESTIGSTLAFSGGLRWAWNEKDRITPSLGLLARFGRADFEAGPALSLAFQLFPIGSGMIAARIDQELWFDTSSRVLDPHLLLGVSWILP
jgi:hypothetical protein